MWFRGQKILCKLVTETWRNGEGGKPYAENFPVNGEIYTIRDIIGTGRLADGTTVYLFLLQEITNPPIETIDHGWIEPNFLSIDFRPLVERKTDISIFEKLLLPNERAGVETVPAGPADVTLTPA